MDTRIKLQEIIERYHLDNMWIECRETYFDISDEELLRIGKRFLELTADTRGEE